ncbi:MAG: FCD domain-containing protein, partial [Actinomycetota bacterium]|nr:FCD domain-containing protein [Actinomycetota bacterium]
QAEAATEAGDYPEAAQCNREFHRAIDTLAASPVSDAALALLWNRILVSTERSLAAPHRAGVVASEHRELIDAIAAGQGRRAAGVARAHVRGTLKTLHPVASRSHAFG